MSGPSDLSTLRAEATALRKLLDAGWVVAERKTPTGFGVRALLDGHPLVVFDAAGFRLLETYNAAWRAVGDGYLELARRVRDRAKADGVRYPDMATAVGLPVSQLHAVLSGETLAWPELLHIAEVVGVQTTEEVAA